MYFRTYLLIKYYKNLFETINKHLTTTNTNSQKIYVIYHFKPDTSTPEGKLFGYVTNTLMNQDEFKAFIATINRIMSKGNISSFDDFF